MTEELSPIYDNVSIPDWADKIHQIKTQELKEVVAKNEVKLTHYADLAKAQQLNDINEAVIAFNVAVKSIILKLKLDILLKHGRK